MAGAITNNGEGSERVSEKENDGQVEVADKTSSELVMKLVLEVVMVAVVLERTVGTAEDMIAVGFPSESSRGRTWCS